MQFLTITLYFSQLKMRFHDFSNGVCFSKNEFICHHICYAGQVPGGFSWFLFSAVKLESPPRTRFTQSSIDSQRILIRGRQTLIEEFTSALLCVSGVVGHFILY